jgi:hypothetical protein
METVTNAANNVASVASRAIWGDQTADTTKQNETGGKEPVSGEVGDVKTGEPYDKGNAEPASKPLTSTSTSAAPAAPSEPETLATTNIEPLTDSKTTTAAAAETETLASTQIDPLKDAKTATDPIGGETGLTPQVKTTPAVGAGDVQSDKSTGGMFFSFFDSRLLSIL